MLDNLSSFVCSGSVTLANSDAYLPTEAFVIHPVAPQLNADYSAYYFVIGYGARIAADEAATATDDGCDYWS